MDVLSEILEKIHLSSAVYFKADFSAPWGMDIPTSPVAQFHIVTNGACLLNTSQGKVSLEKGDLVVFPKGTNHWLADSEQSRKQPGRQVLEAINSGEHAYNENKFSTSLVCGHFEYDQRINHNLIHALPEIIHLTLLTLEEKAWLKKIVELVVIESEKPRQGSEAVVKKLGEVLFIHILRCHIEQTDANSGFLAAMKDERIGASLSLMHKSPDKKWTLDQVARQVGMSRTSLSTRFRDLVGETPMNYLTSWRVIHAKELLRQTNLTVREIAYQSGYQSEAAFNRIFKNRVQITPLKYRHSFMKH